MLRAILRVSWVRQTLLAMNIISNPLGLFFLALFPVSETTSNLRWQVTAIAIGAVLLSFGLAGIILFFFRPKISDHSLVFFSLFALLYAIRLIFRQTFFQSLVPVPTKFWNYCDLVIDNFIAVPLTLFLIEIVPTRWRAALRWLLAGQIAFATARFFSQLFEVGRRPMETMGRQARTDPAQSDGLRSKKNSTRWRGVFS